MAAEIINRVGQADEECRQNGRGQLWHDDFGESLARCAAQIQRCIVQAGIELAQLGAYIKDNIRDIEGDVCNQQRRPAEDAALAADAEILRHDEEQHQRNAGDDLGVDDRYIADVVDDELAFAGHRVDAKGRQRAQHRGDNAGHQRQHKAQTQRGQNHLVVEQAFVPAEGKARKVGTGFALIEAEGNHDCDGQVHEAEHHNNIGAHEERRVSFVHLTSLLPSRTRQSSK